jgi:hypothetical protein
MALWPDARLRKSTSPGEKGVFVVRKSDRIPSARRELSRRALTASQDDARPILQELLAMVHKKLETIRRMAAAHYLEGKSSKDRRNKPDSSDK